MLKILFKKKYQISQNNLKLKSFKNLDYCALFLNYAIKVEEESLKEEMNDEYL